MESDVAAVWFYDLGEIVMLSLYTWKRFQLSYFKRYVGENTVLCVCKSETLLVEKLDRVPDKKHF